MVELLAVLGRRRHTTVLVDNAHRVALRHLLRVLSPVPYVRAAVGPCALGIPFLHDRRHRYPLLHSPSNLVPSLGDALHNQLLLETRGTGGTRVPHVAGSIRARRPLVLPVGRLTYYDETTNISQRTAGGYGPQAHRSTALTADMRISKKRRFGRVFWWIVFALFGLGSASFLWLGTYGLIIDDVYLPNRFGHGGVHVHGVPAWLGAGIEYCLAAVLLSFIVRFGIDPSPHRPFYQSFDKWLKYILFGLLAVFLVAFILAVHKQ